ncbi:MAG: hypothetical protein ABSH13_21350 [Candidatus Acidiferrum sp.]
MAGGGQGGGEAVGVGQIVVGVEFGGLLGEVVGGGDEVDGAKADPSPPFAKGGRPGSG